MLPSCPLTVTLHPLFPEKLLNLGECLLLLVRQAMPVTEDLRAGREWPRWEPPSPPRSPQDQSLTGPSWNRALLTEVPASLSSGGFSCSRDSRLLPLPSQGTPLPRGEPSSHLSIRVWTERSPMPFPALVSRISTFPTSLGTGCQSRDLCDVMTAIVQGMQPQDSSQTAAARSPFSPHSFLCSKAPSASSSHSG